MKAFDLSGRVALVTGAGRGIGREIAQVLAQAGAAIVLADYDEASAHKAAREIADLGRKSLALHVDVRDSTSVKKMTEAAHSAFGQLDILVNNAGIAANTAAEEISDEEWLNVMNVNLHGVFWVCREVAKYMLARGKGSIVNIASMSGLVVNDPQPQSHYNVSKAGVIMLTKSLGAEWAKRGVRVNSVSPGYIGTEMTKQGMSNEAWKSRWLDMTPMAQVGEPWDIAHAVWYLASDAAKFATGTNVVIDGGYTLW